MKDDKKIRISVIIPVKNGDYWLEDTLTAIEKQSLFNCTEIIVIDSGSTDATLRIIEDHQVRLINIDPSAFNHGLTRNVGVAAAKGEYVVMTVQDAKPVNEHWLQELINGFKDDEKVAGVCGQQVVPHDLDKNPIEWFRPQSPPSFTKFQFSSMGEFENLSPSEKRRVCGWDNVTAMYKKEVLLKIPFQSTNFAEDALWARDTLLQGYSIVYNTAARVYHYHLSDPSFVIQRNFTVFYHFYNYIKFKPSMVRNDYIVILKNIKLLIPIKELSLVEKYRWLVYNWRIRKNINKAVLIFHQNCSLGEEDLARKHQEICSTIPVAIKPQSRKV